LVPEGCESKRHHEGHTDIGLGDNGWFKIFDLGTKAWNNNLIDCMSGICTWTGTDRFNSGCL
jgi:hypothetical protein